MNRLTVLQSVSPPNENTNPFVLLQVLNLPAYVESEWFSWRTVFLGRYDLVHFQWPEDRLRAKGVMTTLLKRAAFCLFLVRCRLLRIPWVITVHNLQPHESLDHWGNLILRYLNRKAGGLILLNDSIDVAEGFPGPVRTILHGDYRSIYPASLRRPTRGALVYFGAIRPYKNVPGLIRAFGDLHSRNPSLTLTIAGKVHDSELSSVQLAAKNASNVRIVNGELSNEQLGEIVSGAELVILPYTAMYNSGAVLLALTLHVPVLVPASPSTSAMQQEFGAEWVHTFEGEISSSDIERCLEELTVRTSSAPDLSARDWSLLGNQYGEMYAQVVAGSRRPGD